MLGNGPRKRIHSVTSLTREIKRLLEGGFGTLSVEGEISNMTVARSGHWYFTLKDDKAQLPCVMFKGSNRAFGRAPKEGAQVLISGRLNVYEPRGNYQFMAGSMEDRGAGKLREAFEALKKKLAAEGLFDEAQKRPLPMLPRRIALVTSPEGAAVRDMIRVILRRMPAMRIVVVPTLVQGASAPAQIVAAIERAQTLSEVDLLIVGRGGGSIEDLWAFNDEAVARAISACPQPVISAVGHEVDFTIADFVADVRAATPSVAGELAVPVMADLLAALERQKRQLRAGVRQAIDARRIRLQSVAARLPRPDRQLVDRRLLLDQLTRRLIDAQQGRTRQARKQLEQARDSLSQHHPGRQFERGKARFTTLQADLADAMHARLARDSRSLERLRARLLQHVPSHDLRHQRAEVRSLSRRLHQSAPRLFAARRQALGLMAAKLDGLSPLRSLGRGYALVTRADDRIVRDAGELLRGEHLKIFPERGEIEAIVEHVNPVGPFDKLKGD